jgi:hypothetical protein
MGDMYYPRLMTWVTLVISLLCHGCPVQAIVAAFGFDERSVTNWWLRIGEAL